MRWSAPAAMIALALAACMHAPAPEPVVPPDMPTRHGLQLQVKLYVDNMPRVALDNDEVPCRYLVVPFSIRAGARGLPPGMAVSGMRLQVLGPSGSGSGEPLMHAGAQALAGPDTAEPSAHIAGDSIDATVRETYVMKEVLTTAGDWSSSHWLQTGESMPPGMKKESVFRGVATACRPPGLRGGDRVEVVLQVTAGVESAEMRATGALGEVF